MLQCGNCGDYLLEDAVLNRADETLSAQLRQYGTTRSSIIGECRLLKVTSTAPADVADIATITSAKPVPWTGWKLLLHRPPAVVKLGDVGLAVRDRRGARLPWGPPHWS